jgi:hypothetical protein
VSTNTVLGTSAYRLNTSGSASVVVGNQAGYTNSTGINNVFVGHQAGYSATGNSNSFFGTGAGGAITTGIKNTIIGQYDGNGDSLDIRTANNYAVISDGDGNRLLTTANGQTLALDGGAVPNSGTGITFPATQSASSNANTLDDYEEGTFTLSLQSVASGSVTFGGADEILGIYTKIGRQVHVMAKLVTASVSTPGGDISFQGLPFTTASGITYLKVLVAIEYPAVASVPANTGSTYFTLYLNSTNNMYVYFGDAATTPAGVAFRAGTSISFNFSYTIN